MRNAWLEAVSYLVGHDHRDILYSRQIPQQSSELDELDAPLGHGRASILVAAALVVQLGTEICGDRVQHDQAYTVSLDSYRQLVTDDVVLRLEVVGLDAEDARQRGFFSFVDGG